MHSTRLVKILAASCFKLSTFLLLVFITEFKYSIIQKNGVPDSASNVSYVNKTPYIQVSDTIELKPTDAKILIFGDTALLDPLGERIQKDSNYNPLSKVMEKFREYDYVVGDQEGTIDGKSVGSPNPGKPYTFSTPKESIYAYKAAGIDAFTYANNHARDYGSVSVTHTIDLLHSVGIDVFGAGANRNEAFAPLIKNINGNNIAFLGFDCAEYAYNAVTDTEAGVAYFNEWRVTESIKYAKQNADIVVVLPHCGDEHITTPSDFQKTWASIFTSAGADIVIGAHPHVRQNPEVVNGKPVIYSVGNFMFPGQSWDPEAQKGWAVEVDISAKSITGYKLIESQMNDDGEPSWK